MKKKLTRTQEIALSLIIIIISVMVICWALYNPYRMPTFRTSDEALEYELNQLGVAKPYDIIADYSFDAEDGYSCNRQVYVRSNLFDDEVSVCVSLEKAGSKWRSASTTSVKAIDGKEKINWFYIGDYFDNNWSYTSFHTNYIKELCGGSGYGKMVMNGNVVTMELDYVNRYGNSMDGEHLKNFEPDLIYDYDTETGKVYWTDIRAFCIENGMLLSDEQAAEVARLHIESKKTFMEAAEKEGLTGEKIFEHVYN